MANSSLIIVLALVFATMSMSVHSRLLTNTTTNDASTLAARLKLEYGDGDGDDGGSPGCWETLFELQSCTGEIILFFVNGETYLGPACCMAIEKIERQCWPSLMGSLGFNSQEGAILRGYCDASGDGNLPMSMPPPKPFNTSMPPPKPANTIPYPPRRPNYTPYPPKQANVSTSISLNHG